MERIVVGRSATLTKTFSFTPTGTPTVAVTRSDGTVVTTGSVSGAGTSWSYTIPSSSVTQLDTLTETWTATSGGSPQTFTDYIEVAGGTLFTTAEARAVKPLENTTLYPDSAVADMRTLVEQAMEDKANVAFVPRYELETLSGVGTSTVMLKWPKVTAIRSVTVDGVTVTPTDVIGLRDGFAYYSSRWNTGYGNVVIGYEHGYRTPPARVLRAALFEAKYRLVQANTPNDDRMIQQSFEGGGTTMLQQPGRGGMSFYLPETDQAVAEYSLAVGVA